MRRIFIRTALGIGAINLGVYLYPKITPYIDQLRIKYVLLTSNKMDTKRNYVKELNLIEGEQQNNAVKVIDYFIKKQSDNEYDAFMQWVHPDKEVRDKAKALSEKLATELNELSTSKEVFELIDGLDFSIDDGTSDANTFAHAYTHLVRDMRRSGCHLSEEDNKRAKAISKRMIKLSSDHGANMTNSKAKFELDGDELLAIEPFLKKYDVTIPANNCVELKGYGLYGKILDYCDVESVRRKAYMAFNTVAKENLAILEELQSLRQEYATLLGYANHAEFQLAINSIGTPDEAIKYLEYFRTVLGSNLAQHQQMVTKELGISTEDLMVVYNNNYYMERYRNQKHNVDLSYYRDYFNMDSVLSAMFRVYEQFFEVKFTRSSSEQMNASCPSGKIWHDNVQMIEVHDNEGRYLGKVYLDLYERDGKYSHPSHFGMLHKHRYGDGSVQTATSTLIMSVTQGEPNKPSLLMHDEVVTMFHEFGHAMHFLLNEQDNAIINGTSSVPHDLVEVPSMFLEYLCWDPNFIRDISAHHETGEKLDSEKISTLVATKHVCPSFNYLKQLAYGLYDLEFHTGKATVADYNSRISEISGITRPIETFGIARFGHLVGYDAQYYTYMYSESYAAMLNAFINPNGKPNTKNRKKYLDFLRRSPQVTLQSVLGKNNPEMLIREISEHQ